MHICRAIASASASESMVERAVEGEGGEVQGSVSTVIVVSPPVNCGLWPIIQLFLRHTSFHIIVQVEHTDRSQ